MASEDLIEHYRLDAEVFPSYTIHYSYKVNRALGRRDKVEIRWDRKERLGSGAFGAVWQETNEQPSRPPAIRAVKVIDKRQMERYQVDFRRELEALAVMSRKKYQDMEVLVSFLNWFENDRDLFIAMEYFPYGDLSQHINDIVHEDDVRQITINLLDGLNILHAERFAHRDLKPQNIFVSEKPPHSRRWWVKIGDFGISKRVKGDETAWRTEIGTRNFMAPEVLCLVESSLETSQYSNAVDMWSLGCVVYYCSGRKVPFDSWGKMERFCAGKTPLTTGLLTERLSPAGISFVESLLAPEPADRRTIEEALKDPWILDQALGSEHTEPFTGFGQGITISTNNEQVPTKLEGTDDDSSSSSRARRHPDILTQGAKEPASGPASPQTMWSPATTKGTNKPENATVTKQINRADSNTMKPIRRTLPNASGPQDRQIEHPRIAPQPQPRNNMDPQVSSSQHPDRSRKPASAEQLLVDRQDKPSSANQIVASTTEQKSKPHINWKKTVVLKGHSVWVYSVAFSPDGQLLASGSWDETVRLWDTRTGETRYTLQGHSDRVYSVAFSPDGQLLASGSADKTVRLWDTRTGETRYTLQGHSDRVFSVAFSPDGQLLASGSWDETVRLWDTRTGETRYTLQGHSSLVGSVAFSPDGQLLASGSLDKTVRLWDTRTGETRYTLQGHSDLVDSLAFSPDGQLLASGSWDETVRLWDTRTGETRYTLQGHSDRVGSVAFSPDGQLLASGSLDKTVRLWDTRTGETRYTLQGHSSLVFSVAFSPDGQLLASGSADKTVRLWDTRTGETRYTLQGHSDWVGSVAFSPDGQLLASGSLDKTVRLWGMIPDAILSKANQKHSIIDSMKKPLR